MRSTEPRKSDSLKVRFAHPMIEHCRGVLSDCFAEIESDLAVAVELAKNLEAERDLYRKALEEIRDQDYRGNRSTESQIAWRALNA